MSNKRLKIKLLKTQVLINRTRKQDQATIKTKHKIAKSLLILIISKGLKIRKNSKLQAPKDRVMKVLLKMYNKIKILEI